MNIIGEIHSKADYSGSKLDNLLLPNLLDKYNKYCSGINIVTEPSLGGEFNLARYVSNKTNLPTSIVHFRIDDSVINKVSEIGIDSLIIIFKYNKINIQKIINKCIEKGIKPIVEVNNEEEAIQVMSLLNINTIGINCRNLENLTEVNLEKIPGIVSIIKKNNPNIKIIGESGLDYNSQLNGLEFDIKEWIVGSSIIKSRYPLESVEYFSKKLDLPYIWLRPSAFIGNYYIKINNILEKSGFKVKHTIKLNDFFARFCNLKKELYEKNPENGKIFLSAIKCAVNYIIDCLGHDNGYNEVWFLESNKNLNESYMDLLRIKEKLRKEEDKIVGSIEVNGKKIPIKIHSLHTPDFLDHIKDIQLIHDIYNKREEVVNNFNSILNIKKI